MYMNKTMESIKDPIILSVELNLAKDTLKDMIDEINTKCDQIEQAGKNAILILKLYENNLNEIKSVSESETESNNLDVYLINKWEKALRRIEMQDGITITVCNKNLNSYDIAVLVTTDYRIINTQNKLTLVDENHEIMPGMLLHRLTQQIGHANARKFILWGEEIDSHQAVDNGLVDVASSNVDAELNKFIENLAQRSINDLAVRRRLMNEAISTSYDDALGTHLAACDRLIRREK